MKVAESVRNVQHGNNTSKRQPNSNIFHKDLRLTVERKSDAGVCVDGDCLEVMLLLYEMQGRDLLPSTSVCVTPGEQEKS